MKSGDTYRFSLSWPMDTEERILAGEFLDKLGNKKSRFIIQLVCDYLKSHPDAMDTKAAIQFIVSSTSIAGHFADMVRSIIQTELAGKSKPPHPKPATIPEPGEDSAHNIIGDMFGNLDAWST